MKRFKNALAAILASCLLLTGCDVQNNSSEHSDLSESESSSKQEISEPDSSSRQESSDTQSQPESSTGSTGSESDGDRLNSIIENMKPKEVKIEEIIKLLGDYGDFNYEYLHPQEFEDFTDHKESFVFTQFYSNGKLSNKSYFKITEKELNTPEKFFGKLKSLVTENYLASRLIDNINMMYSAKDGYMYIGSTVAFGYGIGKDIFYIDSVEYPDNETILVKLSTFGEDSLGDEVIDKSTITIKRTEDGLRIDECEGYPELDLYYFKEIIYNGEPYPL